MNNPIPAVFQFESHVVRTVIVGDQPYFVASDVATVLGYVKPRNAVAAHCKGALKRGVPTDGGEQEMLVILARCL